MQLRRLTALIVKESLQIMRDPSALLIAFVLPLVLLFIFGYGVNLDSNRIKIGLIIEQSTPQILELADSFLHSPFLAVTVAHDRRELEPELVAGRLRGLVVIPNGISRRAVDPYDSANIQIIADGSEPNIANFVRAYSQGVVQTWLQQRQLMQVKTPPAATIRPESRFWYNPELKSRNFLVPGSIAIVMTLIGTILTALVIAREWERGTMEALMATPVSIVEILLGKLIPYFLLGLGSMFVCFAVATLLYHVPFRGSLLALVACTAIFLLAALGQGLLISSMARDQFVASQMALMSAFLPAFMLSGFIFEISAMPLPIQALSHVFAARYFVTSLQTLFLTGDIWPLLLHSMLAMLIIAAVFFLIISRKTRKRLD